LGYACAGVQFINLLGKNKNKDNKENDKAINNLRNNVKNSEAHENKTSKIMISKNLPYSYCVVLSVTTKYVDYVKAALTLSEEKNLTMRCIGVSGTLKKLERFLKD
jgi:RNase P/RNase MRP subunit POP5